MAILDDATITRLVEDPLARAEFAFLGWTTQRLGPCCGSTVITPDFARIRRAVVELNEKQQRRLLDIAGLDRALVVVRYGPGRTKRHDIG